jgi:Ser/Thr protein kinase RdoA (MazF antagonist)
VIRTLRSLVDPSELAEVIAAAYGFQVTECVLVRSLVNDVYRIGSANGPRIVKLHRAGELVAAEGPRPDDRAAVVALIAAARLL